MGRMDGTDLNRSQGAGCFSKRPVTNFRNTEKL